MLPASSVLPLQLSSHQCHCFASFFAVYVLAASFVGAAFGEAWGHLFLLSATISRVDSHPELIVGWRFLPTAGFWEWVCVTGGLQGQ
jgi:hypothetical protein